MQSELNHNIRHLPLPQSVREAITAARKQAGTFYAFTEADTPLLIQSQDGTASGKSYNVFAQYIESVNPAINPGNSHRNLVFITPLKSQIDIRNHSSLAPEIRRLNCYLIFRKGISQILVLRHGSNLLKGKHPQTRNVIVAGSSKPTN